ncbi:MAG: 30S ribosomal protein S12 methylthiotransferase RimO [Candidatus Coatesbacteria bacterium]|nr:30S ribosomal protein S12 methylthiotransferase RimO [Candidatus Coatesbacteria bacterium]
MAFISLGCAKALVDTEQMMASIALHGYPIAFDPDDAEVVVINTCSFLELARAESYDVISEFEYKKGAGEVRAIAVVGCLPQLMGGELNVMFQGVDLWIPISREANIATELDELLGYGPEAPRKVTPLDPAPRLLVTPPHTAYLKIAEGCDNCCSYCLIPRIRGPLVSRTSESIVLEARQLAQMGVKELNLIGQDIAAWGRDRQSPKGLSGLVRELCGIDGIEWIRLLYAHPASIDEGMIEAIASNHKVCKYIDMPIQHSENRVLSSMNRRISRLGLISLIERIRARIPEIALRTTLMVGFPGETDAEFERLLEFMDVIKFDRLGAFVYSREPGTAAASEADQIPEELQGDRLERLMALQADISLEKNSALIGSEVEAIIDGYPDDEGNGARLIGRIRAQAPDVDGIISLVGDANPGDIVKAVVTTAGPYDLEGNISTAGQ